MVVLKEAFRWRENDCRTEVTFNNGVGSRMDQPGVCLHERSNGIRNKKTEYCADQNMMQMQFCSKICWLFLDSARKTAFRSLFLWLWFDHVPPQFAHVVQTASNLEDEWCAELEASVSRTLVLSFCQRPMLTWHLTRWKIWWWEMIVWTVFREKSSVPTTHTMSVLLIQNDVDSKLSKQTWDEPAAWGYRRFLRQRR